MTFCKDCKYFSNESFDEYGYHPAMCFAPKPKKVSIIDGSTTEPCCLKPDSENYPNKNMDCKLYKRKWWKFWVKPAGPSLLEVAK